MAECGDGGTAAMGGRTGTHDTLWTWQQHEEAVQGPMTDYGPGSSMRSRLPSAISLIIINDGRVSASLLDPLGCVWVRRQ
ncbi:unnamed protein product, partial [Staurois parvus]